MTGWHQSENIHCCIYIELKPFKVGLLTRRQRWGVKDGISWHFILAELIYFSCVLVSRLANSFRSVFLVSVSVVDSGCIRRIIICGVVTNPMLLANLKSCHYILTHECHYLCHTSSGARRQNMLINLTNITWWHAMSEFQL